MGQIKNWKKSKKYDGTNPQRLTIWTNTLPQYDNFHDNFYVSVSGQNNDWGVSITKNGYQKQFCNHFNNGFSSYKDAVKFATTYMKQNSEKI